MAVINKLTYKTLKFFTCQKYNSSFKILNHLEFCEKKIKYAISEQIPSALAEKFLATFDKSFNKVISAKPKNKVTFRVS